MEYALGEVVHIGLETRIVRGKHPKSGAQMVLKLPRAEAPAPRTLTNSGTSMR